MDAAHDRNISASLFSLPFKTGPRKSRFSEDFGLSAPFQVTFGRQFSDDSYASGDVLFCKFCQHAVDWKHVDACKDHLRSKAHVNDTVLLLLLTLAGPPRPSDDRRCHKHVSGFKMRVCSVFCGCVWYICITLFVCSTY